jgi:ribosomal-protein-alanine N-acetyltransferase
MLRYMRLEDIPQVLDIDNQSFSASWSARSYTFEVNDNENSHMVVLDSASPFSANGGNNPNPNNHSGALTITGYGGFWLISGEAHISTIAVHPAVRRRGLGEVLLAGMLGRGIELEAEYAVLEVRVSNRTALNLYRKYEFEVVGRRRNYYRDNNEDAYQMHLASLNGSYRGRFMERLALLRARVPHVNLLRQTLNKQPDSSPQP